MAADADRNHFSSDEEEHPAITVLCANALIARDAGRAIEWRPRHADRPVWMLLTRFRLESACPLFSTLARARAGLTPFFNLAARLHRTKRRLVCERGSCG